MELITKKVKSNSFNYFLFGDAHKGSVFHHEKGWMQLIDHMRSKIDGMPVDRNIGADHGDTVDAIDPKDNRYTLGDQRSLILQQIEDAKKDRIAIKDQLVFILKGNHEMKHWHMGDIVKDSICVPLGIPYGGFSCKVTFESRGNYLFKHFASHGKRGISSIADDPERRRTNKLLSLKRILRDKPTGDTILCSRGHTHWCDRLKPHADVYFADDGTEVISNNIKSDHTAEYIPPDLRWYVSTGSFYKTYLPNSGLTSYAEAADYNPLPNGYQLCKVRNGVIESIEPQWLE
jgi:hypothetical protein